MTWTTTLPHDFVRAPDGSEIRPLLDVTRGGMSHCTLPPGGVSHAVRHRTIEELWYILAGRGEMWRKQGDREEVVPALPGTCLSIPTGTHFQFRNTGNRPLEIIIASLPPWPGMDEAVRVADHWPVQGARALGQRLMPAPARRRAPCPCPPDRRRSRRS